ncbi:hypothetical protein MMC34_005104 [Xylographa carneopallida]|nr:hypothetical protein [Xylographa carneopallida]
MDPISSTASVLVLVGAAQDAANISLKFLKTIRKAPRGLQALLDEVVRAEAVLMDVKDACQDGQGSTSALNLLLDKARAKLLQLNELIHFKLVKAKAKLEVDRLSFARHQGEVAELKDDLIALRQDITVVLSAASLARTKQIKAHLSEVILAITSMTTEQAFHIGRLPSMALAIQESFPRIEEFQETQQVLTNIRGVICKESATNTAIDDTIPMMTSNGVDDLRSKLQAGYGFSTSMIQSNINMGTGTATTAPSLSCPLSLPLPQEIIALNTLDGKKSGWQTVYYFHWTSIPKRSMHIKDLPAVFKVFYEDQLRIAGLGR